MKLDQQEESNNVEDLRNSSGFQFRPAHGVGLGTIVVALIAGWALGINPLRMLGLLSDVESNAPTGQSAAPAAPAADDGQAKFVSQILRSTEIVWDRAFQEMGRSYEYPELRLFRTRYPTACGLGRQAAGPFYCPNDRDIYLDLSFFDLMTRQLGAPGQFAHAYVIAHEVGHHVQNLIGNLPTTGGDRSGSNGQGVRTELQADCFAGVWANRSQQERGWRLEPGDIETALNAAAQIGDDTLQRRSEGVVVPESFTHGTSAQRVSWFKRGLESGRIGRCDTFAAGAP
jgi:predicted metalloprotease